MSKTNLPKVIRRLFPHVNSVIDAMGPVEISVNRKDCKDATKLNPSECALARAARRELQIDGAIIGISTSYIIQGDEAVRFQTPNSVQREIVSFDRHHDFSPGSYVLSPKSPSNRLHFPLKIQKKNKVSRRYHHSTNVRILASGTSK